MSGQPIIGLGGGGSGNPRFYSTTSQPQSLADYSPETQAELARQERRRQVMTALMQQGLAQGHAYTQAGRFIVPRGWGQNLADLVKVGVGAWGNVKADEAAKEATTKEQQAYADAIKAYKASTTGTPAQPERFTGGEEVGGEAMPAQAPTPDARQKAILALMESRIPAAQRYGLMQQGVLDAQQAREDAQAQRTAEQQAALAQRKYETDVRAGEQKAARETEDARMREMETARLVEVAQHNREMERLKGDENKRNAEVERHNREMEKIGLLTAQRAGLKPGEVVGKGGQVELREGTQAYMVQKDKYAKDVNTLNLATIQTDMFAKKLDRILAPENKDAFNANFGGYNAYVSRLTPNNPLTGKVQDIRNEIESIKDNFKLEGLKLMRQGGSIGQMTQQEWPIVQNILDRIDSGISEGRARELFEEAREYLNSIKANAKNTFETEWKGSQFDKPGAKPAATPTAAEVAKPTAPTPAQKQAYDKTQIDALLEKYK